MFIENHFCVWWLDFSIVIGFILRLLCPVSLKFAPCTSASVFLTGCYQFCQNHFISIDILPFSRNKNYIYLNLALTRTLPSATCLTFDVTLLSRSKLTVSPYAKKVAGTIASTTSPRSFIQHKRNTMNTARSEIPEACVHGTLSTTSARCSRQAV